ncbi:MAG: NADH-quinone oxidoreductase subunit NuoN [Actinomycetota bacterium]|nr:NADH-quinone oxidoreductase subunit NuoN [Actinomycetota bacterium]
MPHPPLSFGPVAPELVLVGMGLTLLLVDALFPRIRHGALVLATLAGLAGAAAVAAWLWNWHGPLTVLGDMVAADRFAVFARMVVLAVAAVGVLLGHHYFERTGEARGEFYPLLLLCTSGMTLIVAASNLIMVFLALEILSLSLYVLTGFSLRLASIEGAMKYFLLGAFSSAFFLYGIALAYGATGTTSIAGMARALSGRPGALPLALAAAGLLAVGFAFKVAAVPFHMWAPDAYQGAPTPITAYMSAATKVAAFAAFIRVFDVAFQPLSWDWTPFVWVLAAVTMVVGSVLAIAQTDVKRMLAYSSVAHAGFILTGITAANQDGIQAALFYLVAYAAMIVGAFGVVMVVSIRGEDRTGLTSYAGLARRNPLAAGFLALFLLSLAGIPPTAGFIAKFSVFKAAVDAGHWPLVLIAVLASVIAAFFYLRVIVLMYMQDPQDEVVPETRPVPALAMAAPAALTLLFGVFPQIVFGFLRSAAILRW